MSQFCDRSITRILLRSIACIDVLSSLSAVSYRIKNDLINQLFDGRTVISKIDVACLLLADMSISNTGISDTFECWIGHSGSVSIKVAERCPRVGTNNQAILKALRIYDIDIGKGRAHSLRQRFYKTKITAGTSGIDHRYSCRGQMRANLVKKLGRSQLKGYIGLLIGIDADQIILLFCRLQKVAPIFHNDMQVGFVHMKIALCQVNNRAIDLDSVDRNRPIDRVEFARDCTRSQSDDRDKQE